MPRSARSKKPANARRARNDGTKLVETPAEAAETSMPPPSEFEGLLDDVKATTLALMASLQAKEKTLRERAEVDPSPGVTRGLDDIAALRRWADRLLGTIGLLEKGRRGEFHALLEELGEFGDILREKQPSIPPEPPLTVRG